MAGYRTPGVYIEEIPKLPPSIASVETAIPAFIGYTAIARRKEEGDLINQGTRITSMLEYEQFFGGANPEQGLIVTFSTRNGRPEIQAKINPERRSKFLMYYSLQMFFANGGGPCYIMSVGNYASSGGLVMDTRLRAGLTEVAKIDEVTLIVFPDAINLSDGSTFYALYTDAIKQAAKLQDRFVIMDVFHSPQSMNYRENIQFLRDN